MTHHTRPIQATYLYVLSLIICLSWAVSCQKQNGGSDVKLIFSCENNTLTFDTVFTSIPSITKRFTAYNPSKSDVTTSIYLAGGTKSKFSINVNGMPGTHFKDVTIPAKDSIFIFIKVNIDPTTDKNLPFLITDSIVFMSDSRTQDVDLIAYGQDANYIVADKGSGYLRYKVVASEHQTVTWTKDKPYVVYGWAVIDSTATLIIEPGTKIYFHNSSGLWAYRSSNLKVNGTLTEPVLFRGDRLEAWYNEDYAQWEKIWINEGAHVDINYAVITNAFIGVQVDPLVTTEGIFLAPTHVKIENTIIKNTKNSGVLARFLSLEMINCVIANNGGCGVQLEIGEYTMKHLTIANYFMQAERKNPACFVSNKISDLLYSDISAYKIKADFINCIITGNNDTEVGVNKATGAELEASFKNCLVKSKNNADFFIECLHNEDPLFTDKSKLDFTLLPASPAIGKGRPNIGVNEDILGNSRGNPPDIGAYQFKR